MSIERIVTNTEQDTSATGERLAGALRSGDVVLLFGELGAGKTAFVRGLARGLGTPEEDVSSPTFTLIQEYLHGRVPLYHVDLYRLEPPEITDLGLDELISGEAIVAIEWADRWPDRPTDAIEVTISHLADNGRTIEIVSNGAF
jgi:tRNA threonylcarbamoyladenosine biosynthesis protein TsaE